MQPEPRAAAKAISSVSGGYTATLRKRAERARAAAADGGAAADADSEPEPATAAAPSVAPLPDAGEPVVDLAGLVATSISAPSIERLQSAQKRILQTQAAALDELVRSVDKELKASVATTGVAAAGPREVLALVKEQFGAVQALAAAGESAWNDTIEDACDALAAEARLAVTAAIARVSTQGADKQQWRMQELVQQVDKARLAQNIMWKEKHDLLLTEFARYRAEAERRVAELEAKLARERAAWERERLDMQRQLELLEQDNARLRGELDAKVRAEREGHQQLYRRAQKIEQLIHRNRLPTVNNGDRPLAESLAKADARRTRSPARRRVEPPEEHFMESQLNAMGQALNAKQLELQRLRSLEQQSGLSKRALQDELAAMMADARYAKQREEALQKKLTSRKRELIRLQRAEGGQDGRSAPRSPAGQQQEQPSFGSVGTSGGVFSGALADLSVGNGVPGRSSLGATQRPVSGDRRRRQGQLGKLHARFSPERSIIMRSPANQLFSLSETQHTSSPIVIRPMTPELRAA